MFSSLVSNVSHMPRATVVVHANNFQNDTFVCSPACYITFKVHIILTNQTVYDISLLHTCPPITRFCICRQTLIKGAVMPHCIISRIIIVV